MEPKVQELLDPKSGESDWFKRALRGALRCDPHQVMLDSQRLAGILATLAKGGKL